MWHLWLDIRNHDLTSLYEVLWLGGKKTIAGISAQSENHDQTLSCSGTRPLKVCTQGLFSPYLKTLRQSRFSSRLVSSRLTAPGSPRIRYFKSDLKLLCDIYQGIIGLEKLTNAPFFKIILIGIKSREVGKNWNFSKRIPVQCLEKSVLFLEGPNMYQSFQRLAKMRQYWTPIYCFHLLQIPCRPEVVTRY